MNGFYQTNLAVFHIIIDVDEIIPQLHKELWYHNSLYT